MIWIQIRTIGEVFVFVLLFFLESLSESFRLGTHIGISHDETKKKRKQKKKQSRIFTLMWNFLKNSSWGRVASFSRFPLSQLHLKNYINWSGVGKGIFIPLPRPFKSGTWQPCTQNTKTDTNISSTKQIKIQTKALHYTPNGMSCNYLT